MESFFSFCALSSLLISLGTSLSVSAGDLIVRSEFESPLYAMGNLNGQNGWAVSDGNAQIISGVSARGDQSVSSDGATYQMNVSSAASVVWVDSWNRDVGSSSQPLIPDELRSCVLCFSSTRGLLALDGDGDGNGVFVTVDSDIPSDQFVRVTLRIDYVAARYDVWVNGVLKVSNLGFKDNSVMALEEIQRQTDGVAYFDALTVATRGLDEDRDGDGLSDLDEISGDRGAVTSPDNPDSDGDGYSDGDEWLMGSSPINGTSFFHPKHQLSPDGKFQFAVEAHTGRSYTMQTSTTLSKDSWVDVAGATNITGNDGEMLLIEDSNVHGDRQFYRIIINHSL